MGCLSERTSIDEYFVPWVREAKAYSGDHIVYAWEHPSIDRLMANENFHPPSEKVIKAVTDAARKGNLYPRESGPLKERLAKMVISAVLSWSSCTKMIGKYSVNIR